MTEEELTQEEREELRQWLADFDALKFEYKLTITFLSYSCHTCARYFVSRKDVLIPEIMTQAVRNNESPIDVLVRFRDGVRTRHGC